MNDYSISPHRAKKPEIRHVCTDFLLQNDCLQIVNKGFRGTDHHAGVVRHGFGEEGVAAHHGVFADDSQVIDYQHKPHFTPNLQTRLDNALETFWHALHRRDIQAPAFSRPQGVAHV